MQITVMNTKTERMKSKIFLAPRLVSVIAVLLLAIISGNICNGQVTVNISASAGTISPTGTTVLTATVTGTSAQLKYFYTGTNTNGHYQVDSVNPATVTGPGIYYLLVTDTNYIALGQAVDTIFSTVLPSGSGSILDSAYSCAGSFGGGKVILDYTGFFVPLNITFSPLGPFAIGPTGSYVEPVQDTFAGFGPGQYILTITDVRGQSITDTINMPSSTVPDFSSYITASPDTIGTGQNTVITVHFQGGVPPYSTSVLEPGDILLTWNTSDTVYSYTTPLAGIWEDSSALDLGTGNEPRCNVYGGQVQVYNNCNAGQCVWPGDANWDGIVNNFDLLPIGLAYDSTGPVRPDTTIAWYGHYAPQWNDSLQDSINYKYIDCNGNGVINADDTIAIMQNYSLTYTRGGGFGAGGSNDPVLYPNVIQDTVYDKDTLTIQLLLGSAGIPANNVYGLAFTLNYDPTVVDTTKTVATFGNSWLGTSADKISIAKDLKPIGQLQCALTRINHTTKSGSGSIGVVSFVITTDNLNGKTYSFYNALFYISNIKMIDSAGNVLPLGGGIDSTEVGFLPMGITQINGVNNLVHIYPNPANSQLMVSYNGVGMKQIKITDVIGNELISRTYSGSANVIQQQLDISEFNPGIYMVEVITDKGVATEKLVVAR